MYIPFEKDTLQKMSLIAFAQATLITMGDMRKVVGFYPTELIIPTFRQRLMDGVLELDDGTLLNVEFQTGDIKETFLLRCAQYAINLRVISARFVETNIISNGVREKSKNIAFISKFFPFKPKLFFYSEFDGLEKLINIKNKIKNQEKLSQEDHYNLIFIPLMGNVDRVKVSFDVFNIVNDKNIFDEGEQEKIKRCQYVVAQIVADGVNKLLNEFWEIIKMNNNFLVEYETKLIENARKKAIQEVTEEVTKKVTEEVTEKVTEEVTEKVTEEVTGKITRKLAKNFKEILNDNEIAKYTGLSLEEVQNL